MTTSEEIIREATRIASRVIYRIHGPESTDYESADMDGEQIAQALADAGLLRQEMTEAARDVLAERVSHAECGYDAKHDRTHGVDHLVDWAGRYATRRMDDRRTNLVKATSLLLAAIELMDEVPDGE